MHAMFGRIEMNYSSTLVCSIIHVEMFFSVMRGSSGIHAHLHTHRAVGRYRRNVCFVFFHGQQG